MVGYGKRLGGKLMYQIFNSNIFNSNMAAMAFVELVPGEGVQMLYCVGSSAQFNAIFSIAHELWILSKAT
jgi:hypothetical protein